MTSGCNAIGDFHDRDRGARTFLPNINLDGDFPQLRGDDRYANKRSKVRTHSFVGCFTEDTLHDLHAIPYQTVRLRIIGTGRIVFDAPLIAELPELYALDNCGPPSNTRVDGIPRLDNVDNTIVRSPVYLTRPREVLHRVDLAFRALSCFGWAYQ